jgi:hypothetical protein
MPAFHQQLRMVAAVPSKRAAPTSLLGGVDLDLLHRHVGVSVEPEITNCTSCAR